MTRVILLLLLISSSFSSYAQYNFKDAYIVTLENDTVYGYADFRSDALNLSECLFKKDLESKIIESYESEDILGYGFIHENKIYISQKINIAGIDSQVFLEYLVKGESASLFYYEYKEQENYEYTTKQIFIVKDIYGDLNVISKKEDKMIEGLKIKKDVSFRNRLFSVLGFHADMQPILKKTDFSRRSMTSAIKKYNDITCGTPDACIVYKAPNKIYLKLNYAFYAGAKNLKLTNFDSSKYTLDKSQIKPEIGVQFMLSYPRISNSLSLVVDISASQIKQELDRNTIDYHYKLSATTLDIGVGLKYIYPKGKLRPGFGFGLGKLYFLDKKLETKDKRSKFNSWLDDSYLEFAGNLSLDYMLKNNHSAFLSFNYSTDLDHLLFSNIQQDKYMLSARAGYRF